MTLRARLAHALPAAHTPLRIGVLGAARITQSALLRPAREVSGVTIAAVAARDPERASAYARGHGITRTLPSYEAVLADPEIDAVYVPLPAALHAEWTLGAIAAGKHVLCEKPFTANAPAARRIALASASAPVTVMEAYHTRHHPLTNQLRELIEHGAIGRVRSAFARFCIAIPPGRDIRWQLELGGGGLLDIGYYPVRLLRDLFGEPTIHRARALERDGIDRMLEADLAFAGGITGRVESAMWAAVAPGTSLRIDGTLGRISVFMPYHPHAGRITLDSRRERTRIRPDRRSTYSFQLEAFRDAIAGVGPNLTDAPAAVAQMTVLDALYEAAGMAARPSR